MIDAARFVVWQMVRPLGRRQLWCLAALVACVATVACHGRATDSSPSAGAVAPTMTAIAAPTSSTALAPAGGTGPTTTALPADTGPAVVLSRGSSSRPMVALTFDAGADRGNAGAILEILSGAGIRASFGLTGKWAEENADLVTRIARDGHLIINHTYDHRSFTGVSAKPAVTAASERLDQLARTDTVLKRVTGRSAHPWFRPPYGDYDASVNRDVGGAGYRYSVLWTVDSLGWQGLSPGAITARCLQRAEPGAIYLFHVGAASQDAAALPAIVAGLRQQGYTFGTVADLLEG